MLGSVGSAGARLVGYAVCFFALFVFLVGCFFMLVAFSCC